MDFNQDIIDFYKGLPEILRDKPEIIDLFLKAETLIEIKTANSMLLKLMFGDKAFGPECLDYFEGLQHICRQQVVESICRDFPHFDFPDIAKEFQIFVSKKRK